MPIDHDDPRAWTHRSQATRRARFRLRAGFPIEKPCSIPVPMGTARFESAMDYARREVDVAIRCEGCRRVRNMTAEQLGAVFGLDGKRLAIERRLRCSHCGHRGAKLAPIPQIQGRTHPKAGEA